MEDKEEVRMDLSAITGAAAAAEQTAAPKKNDELGKDAFMTLLVEQLKNQDPLEPMDNSDFVAQLAQFSSLESLTNLQTSMDGVTAGMNKVSDYYTASLIGRTIKTEGDAFAYTGDPVELGFAMEEAAASVTVSIVDPQGGLVNKVDLGARGPGYHSVGWDGLTGYGTEAAPGNYAFYVDALNADGEVIESSRFVNTRIHGVDYSSGDTRLMTDSGSIPAEGIKEIY